MGCLFALHGLVLGPLLLTESPSETALHAIARYLQEHAEPEVLTIDCKGIEHVDAVIVIPIYDESEATLASFLGFNNKQAVLMIWVFNAPESAAGAASHLRTRDALRHFIKQLNAKTVGDSCYYARVHACLNIILVDRCQRLIPDKQGVGLARKLGTDLALQLSYQQSLQSGQLVNWLYSTDADVRLPSNYALISLSNPQFSAVLYPFRHQPVDGYADAMQQYEFSLYYYVDRLHYAGSPYAFHTIGSLLAIKPLAYAQVRGFPKRSGAEDFYILNKLAKVGKVLSIDSPVLDIAGRPSHRVPFGTGPALIKLKEAGRQPFTVYHPRVFELLHAVLRSLDDLFRRLSAPMEQCISIRPFFLEDETIRIRDDEAQIIIDVLLGLGWEKQVAHFRQQKTLVAFERAFHTWFDAFVTLRFVHELRDRLCPNIELKDLHAHNASYPLKGATIDYPEWFNSLGVSGSDPRR